MKKVLENCKELLLIGLGILLYCILLKLLGISCPIKELTGISCPGCGMTRAMMHAFLFRFSDAFYFHPLWILLPFFVVALFILYFKDKRRAFKIVLIILILMFIVVYIFRAIFGDGVVVSFEPQESFVFKIINKVKALLNGN